MTSVFHKILRAVAGAMEIPDVVFLVLALGFAVFSVGWLICEYFTEKSTQPAAEGRPARADGAP